LDNQQQGNSKRRAIEMKYRQALKIKGLAVYRWIGG